MPIASNDSENAGAATQAPTSTDVASNNQQREKRGQPNQPAACRRQTITTTHKIRSKMKATTGRGREGVAVERERERRKEVSLRFLESGRSQRAPQPLIGRAPAVTASPYTTIAAGEGFQKKKRDSGLDGSKGTLEKGFWEGLGARKKKWWLWQRVPAIYMPSFIHIQILWSVT